MKKNYKFFIIIVLTFLVIIPVSLIKAQQQFVSQDKVSLGVGGTLQEELDALEKELSQIQSEKKDLQSQIDAKQYTVAGYSAQLSALYGEVLVFQKEIEELELKIKELELNVQILEQEIEKTKKEIEKNEKVVKILEDESERRISNNYMNFRLYSGETSNDNLFNLDDINSYFKDSQYKEIIQSNTNDMLVELARLKEELRLSKEEFDDQLVQVKKDREILDIQRDELDKKQAEIEVKIAAYYAQINAVQKDIDIAKQGVAVFEQQEAETRAQAELVRQQIFNNFRPISAGQWVLAGTMIGKQGSTGYSTGPHLHFSLKVNNIAQDPCAFLPSGGPVSGCGWGNQLQWPIRGTVYYTSGFGNRCFYWNGQTNCSFHDGADFAGQPWNTPIYAAHNGYLYKGYDCWFKNMGMDDDCALYAIVCENSDCGTGYKSGYWHLSEF